MTSLIRWALYGASVGAMAASFLFLDAMDAGGSSDPRWWVVPRRLVEVLLALVAVPMVAGATVGVVIRLISEAVLARRRA
jgi:hypothetical protein